MERTIKITGRSRLYKSPDQMELSFFQSGTESDYGKALSRAEKENEALRQVARDCGFLETALKTADFGVHPRYESIRDENGNYQQKFVGYEFSQRMLLKTERDSEKLGELLEKVAAAGLSPEFSVAFGLRDTESFREELVAEAVADSRRKAEKITAAAGVALGDVLSIDYSWEAAEVYTHPVNRMALATAKRMDLALEPEDVELSDSVTVTWEIK